MEILEMIIIVELKGNLNLFSTRCDASTKIGNMYPTYETRWIAIEKNDVPVNITMAEMIYKKGSF